MSSESTLLAIFVFKQAQTTAWEAFTSMSQTLDRIKRQPVTPVSINFLTKAVKAKIRPVGWGGSRGSNKPPKIFEVGIFGRLKRQKNVHKTIKRL